MKRGHDEMDQWLQDRIDEDLMAMADEREKLLMESEELQNIEMPMERLQDIHREIEKRRLAGKKLRVRRRVAAAVAAIAVACVGMGLVGSGTKLYKPEILEVDLGNGKTTKIDNTETKESSYDEEVICQEIADKVGVVPVRLGYQPEGIYISEYWIKKDEKSALVCYQVEEDKLYICISKDVNNATINNQSDGIHSDTVEVISCGLEVKASEYLDENGEIYYTTSFEYLNTYYSVVGVINKEEFIKILENIAIKNV